VSISAINVKHVSGSNSSNLVIGIRPNYNSVIVGITDGRDSNRMADSICSSSNKRKKMAESKLNKIKIIIVLSLSANARYPSYLVVPLW
jgi:hypothetical protein